MSASPINANGNQRIHTSPGDEMLTIAEACELLRLPEGTLRYWRHLGAGPRSFKLGRHVRYWKTDLLLWLSEQTNNAPQTPQPAPYPQPFQSPSTGRGAGGRS